MITVARRPLAGTVAENVVAHEAGALNIRGCRVLCAEGETVATKGRADALHGDSCSIGSSRSGVLDHTPRAGRWPANLVVAEGVEDHHGFFLVVRP